MLDEVLATLFERGEILLGVRVGQGLSRSHLGSSTVHLQRTSRRDDDDSIRRETTDTALDVAELLHAHVRAEAALGEDVPDAVGRVALFDACELERDAVGEGELLSETRQSVANVRSKGTYVAGKILALAQDDFVRLELLLKCCEKSFAGFVIRL